MKKLGTLTSAAALMAVLGFAGTAVADDNADAVPTYNEGAFATANNPANAVDANNGTFTSLGLNGDMTTEFTDNVAVDDAGNDIRIFDRCGENEGVDVLVSNDGVNFVSLGSFTAGDFTNDNCGLGSFNATLDLDLAGSGLGGATHVKIVDDNDSADEDGTDDDGIFEQFYGLDVEEVVALNNFNLGTAHILKGSHTFSPGNIEIQAKGASDELQFFWFKITITNGGNENLTGIVFKDVLPAEFDLNPAAEEEDNDDGSVDGACFDNICDGETFTGAGFKGAAITGGTNALGCSVLSAAEHTNNGKPKPFKLQPDIVTISAAGLGGGQSCEITVYAQTDQKSNRPNKVNHTPTSCTGSGYIMLNEGVEVIDTMNNADSSDDVTLFIDDDTIKLTCIGPFPT